eukprot:COSAG02_NODE_865_length_16381_cov_14.799533_1_plen_1064_part_00
MVDTVAPSIVCQSEVFILPQSNPVLRLEDILADMDDDSLHYSMNASLNLSVSEGAQQFAHKLQYPAEVETIQSYRRFAETACSSLRLHNGGGESFTDALAACESDATCAGISDFACDDEWFTLCEAGSTAEPSQAYCSYMKPEWRGVILGSLPVLPAGMLRTASVTVADQAGNVATCTTDLTVSAPVIQFSESVVSMSALVSSSTDLLDLNIANNGFEELRFRSGTTGMSVVDANDGPIPWVEVRTQIDSLGRVAVAGTGSTGGTDVEIRVAPGGSAAFTLQYFGAATAGPGSYSGNLTVTSNDPARPVVRLPLTFHVSEYAAILIALPESTTITGLPGTKSTDYLTLYNVFSGAVDWTINEGCECSGAGLFPCQLLPYDGVESLLVELRSCSGSIPIADSRRIDVQVTIPTKVGSFQKAWNFQPSSGGEPMSFESFLRSWVDATVISSASGFAPASSRFVPGSDEAARASRPMNLRMVPRDHYENEISTPGIDGWKALLRVADTNETVSLSVSFDFENRIYATETLIPSRKGEHTIWAITHHTTDVTHSLLTPTTFAVSPLECSPPAITASIDGAQCLFQRCDPGSKPTDDQLRCEQCQRGLFSADGLSCAACPDGSFSDETGADECRACAPGKTSTEHRESCVECPFGSAGAGGTCADCRPGEQPNEAKTACISCNQGKHSPAGNFCDACLPGTEALLNRSGCVLCAAKGSAFVSATGMECSRCAPGSQPNYERTACESCISLLDSFLHSVDGSACIRCPDGHEPTVQRTGCRACSAGSFSTGGTACVSCAAGQAANAERTKCETCPAGRFSEDGNQCVDCEVPRVTVLASQARVGCAACAPGSEPDARYEGCQDCSGASYSPFGIDCSPCVRPRVVNTQHTSCTACEPGKGPNEAFDSCEACIGLNYSSFGICLECAIPNVVIPDPATGLHSSCTRCIGGQEPTDSRHGCRNCAADNHSPFGVACAPCSAGTEPDEYHINCDDVDECAVSNGNCDGIAIPPICTNVPGTRKCGQCPDGYVGSADRAVGPGCLLPEIDSASTAVVQLQTVVKFNMPAIPSG